MSWSGASWNVSQGEIQALKFKQIDSLRQYIPTIKEVTRDVVYEAPITLPRQRTTITLRITLAADFPRSPPSLSVMPAVSHRLVDPQQHIYVLPQAHENLAHWTVHASLGKTVYEITQKFMQDPPTILAQAPGTTSPTLAPSPLASPSQPPYLQQPPPPAYKDTVSPGGQSLPPQSHTPLPVIPATFPELESKTPTELANLINDETEFKKFFDGLACVQTMKKVRDDLRSNNEEIAKRNLVKEAEIEKLRAEVSVAHQQVTEKKSTFDQKVVRQNEILAQFTTPILIEKLANAATKAEEESDEIANKYLAGQLDHKDFLKEFMEKRKLYHLRAAKKESLMLAQTSK